jgi:hypothetical protein
MSRSQYIWIIRNFADGGLLAAFTVKYECAFWISRTSRDVEDLSVCRMRDGFSHPGNPPVHLDPYTLEPYGDPEDGE